MPLTVVSALVIVLGVARMMMMTGRKRMTLSPKERAETLHRGQESLI
jgi:hypothetical protein